MSGATEQTTADASAIAKRAADLVSAQRSTKDWSDERQAELEAWLAASLAHRVAYLRIDAAWQRTERLAALHMPMRPISAETRSQSTVWRRIAVSLGLAAILGLASSPLFQGSHSQLIETPKGGQEKVTLADGSQIELNTDTAVRVDFQPDRRSVELVHGEAYFEVRHDAARPFAVTARGRRIVDLGTKFVVRLARQEVKVSLLEGKASFENLNSAQKPVLLSPGDVAIATADATHVSRASTRTLADSLAWRRGSVVFHYERLGDAVAELNRYGGPQIVVGGASTTKLLISGTFLTNRPEEFAGMVHEIFGLRVEHKNGDLVLSR